MQRLEDGKRRITVISFYRAYIYGTVVQYYAKLFSSGKCYELWDFFDCAVEDSLIELNDVKLLVIP